MTRHSATGRADLLRALAQGVESPLALDAGESGWFGYRQRPTPVVSKPAAELQVQPVVLATATAAPEAAGPDRRQPLQMETIWAVVERTAVSTEATDEAPGEVAVQPITEEDARGLDRIVDYEDLIPWARLTPVLRRRLSQPRRGGIDLKRLCRQVAAQRPLKHLPRQVLSRWHPDIVVALDFSPRLWPYRWDMHRLCEQLRRHCGRTGLSLRLFAHGPWGGWTEWLTDEEADGAEPMEPQVWAQPPAGARLLVVGDLGSLSPDDSLRVQWRDWIQQAHTAGVRVEALLPLGADQLPAELAGLLPTIRWSPDSHLRPESGSQRAGADFADGSAEAVDDSLHDLLAQVASLRRVDPPLLRAMRRALPHEHGNAGLEGAVWSHPDVEAGLACAVQPAKAQPWLDRCRRLPAVQQKSLQALRRDHHRHLRAALQHEEVLLQAAHSDNEILDPVELAGAEAFMGRLSRWLGELPAEDVPEAWLGFVQEAVRRVDSVTAKRFSKIYTRLVAVELKQQVGRANAAFRAPDWAESTELFVMLASAEVDLPIWWIVEDRRVGLLLLQSSAPEVGQRVLWSAEGEQIMVREAGAGGVQSVPLREKQVSLGPSRRFTNVEVDGSEYRYVIAPVRRPFGIEEWSFQRFEFGRTNRVLPRVLISQLDGSALGIDEGLMCEAPTVSDPDQRYHLTSDPSIRSHGNLAESYGVDRYGVFVDITIAGVNQRLRHLPPGRFLMGSPIGEPDRQQREGPQHEVTLTRGIWLADTCCTQALWRAVMGGKNPSEFTGDPNLPVDSVSWDDVQTFLGRLQRQLPPGVEAVLPTEAQWEYACRAGTEAAYHFGEQIHSDQVNYDGNYPPSGGRQGEYRKHTVPVKALPANAWGLYQMHGNLWEWCADALRDYTAEPVEDPDGGQGGVARVLRGGSWLRGAGPARSACRLGGAREPRYQAVGFRFALRSIEPSAGGGISRRAESARVLPQVEPGAGVGPAEPGPRAEGIWSRMSGLFKGRK